jgi:glycosyltransferase involved in cell wall biosynthesis
MKVLHVPYGFFPDLPGGTEIYVQALARIQKENGLELAVAAAGPEDARYIHDGYPVYRFRTSRDLPLRALYGEGDAEAASSFESILKSVHPDIVHMHAFTSGVSIRLVRAAHRHSIPVVFNYHTPTVSCSRGTLMRWGRERCDGRMDVRRCAACRLHSKGMPKTASRIVAHLPAALGRSVGALGLSGSRWTALRAGELMEIRHGAARALFAEAECIVAVCQWVRDLLILNGVDPSKIVLSRQGLTQPVSRAAEGKTSTSLPLRLAFLGRVDPIKGLDVLIAALQSAPELPVTLDVYAVTQSDSGQELKTALAARSSRDSRIRFFDPISPEGTVERLREYDILAVPSQGLETGPLVVYEAFAAGVPVVGSNLGGIAELVEHEKNGLLVEGPSVSTWAGALKRLVAEPRLLPALRRGIGPVRTMGDVAGEMLSVYERVR